MPNLNLSNLRSSATLRASGALNESIVAKSVRTFSADATNSDVRVFLSYRRNDREKIEALVERIREAGASVFVDYLDEELLITPSTRVANVLRERMRSCKKLIQLVTPNSKGSIWMPWELGIGDGILKSQNLVILPGDYGDSKAASAEYYAVYGKIDVQQNWWVDKAEGGGVYFKDWLRS